jgi:hypothetical protein
MNIHVSKSCWQKRDPSRPNRSCHDATPNAIEADRDPQRIEHNPNDRDARHRNANESKSR